MSKRTVTKMVVKTQRVQITDFGTWVLYRAHIWVQYNDGKEYTVCVPLHVPHDEVEEDSSYALHDHVCQRAVYDQLFEK